MHMRLRNLFKTTVSIFMVSFSANNNAYLLNENTTPNELFSKHFIETRTERIKIAQKLLNNLNELKGIIPPSLKLVKKI